MKTTCFRCGKDFIRLDKHLKNKKKCKNIYLNIDRVDMINKYNEYFEDFIKVKNNINNENSIKKYNCDYCNKIFKFESNLKKHIKICFHSSNEDLNLNSNFTSILDSNYKKNNIIIQNNTTNINNDNIILNDNTNNIHLHITLNNFGKETELTEQAIKKIFNGEIKDILSSYVRLKHIEIEENRNILVTSVKSKILKKFINDTWEYAPKNITMKEVMNMSVINLIKTIQKIHNNFIEDYKNKTPDEDITQTALFKKIEKIKKYLYEIEDNLENNRKNIDEEISILCELLNGKDKVIETLSKIESYEKILDKDNKTFIENYEN